MDRTFFSYERRKENQLRKTFSELLDNYGCGTLYGHPRKRFGKVLFSKTMSEQHRDIWSNEPNASGRERFYVWWFCWRNGAEERDELTKEEILELVQDEENEVCVLNHIFVDQVPYSVRLEDYLSEEEASLWNELPDDDEDHVWCVESYRNSNGLRGDGFVVSEKMTKKQVLAYSPPNWSVTITFLRRPRDILNQRRKRKTKNSEA